MLLCVLSWDGPLPVIHHHGGLNSDWLREHLKTVHADSTTDELGFHWHLMRLRDLGSSHSGNDSANPADAASHLTAARAVVSHTLMNTHGRFSEHFCGFGIPHAAAGSVTNRLSHCENETHFGGYRSTSHLLAELQILIV